MSHLRRYLVPLLLMLPVIFICGKLLITPVNVAEVYGDPTGDLIPNLKQYDRGWPWFFTHEQKKYPPAVDAGKISRTWFSIGMLLKDVAVLTVIGVTAWIALLCLRRRSGGSLRFSLRGLFVIVTLAAVGCGWWMYHDRRYRQEQSLLKALGAEYGALDERLAYCGPDWLRRFVSDDGRLIFKRAIELQVQLEISDHSSGKLPENLENGLRQLKHLQKVTFRNKLANPFSEAHPHLKITDTTPIENVEELVFQDYTADDETLDQLPKLKNLTKLEIYGGAITDRGMAAIGRCQSLKVLQVERFMNAELTHMPVLGELEELTLKGFELKESAFEDLLQMKSLTVFDFSTPKISDSSLRRLVELPELYAFYLNSDEKLSQNTIDLLKQRLYFDEY